MPALTAVEVCGLPCYAPPPPRSYPPPPRSRLRAAACPSLPHNPDQREETRVRPAATDKNGFQKPTGEHCSFANQSNIFILDCQKLNVLQIYQVFIFHIFTLSYSFDHYCWLKENLQCYAKFLNGHCPDSLKPPSKFFFDRFWQQCMSSGSSATVVVVSFRKWVKTLQIPSDCDFFFTFQFVGFRWKRSWLKWRRSCCGSTPALPFSLLLIGSGITLTGEHGPCGINYPHEWYYPHEWDCPNEW